MSVGGFRICNFFICFFGFFALSHGASYEDSY